jgi:aryl-alcohol dehydrogenase-like predicted oxidoreductase
LEYRNLGRSGLEVSTLCLGTMTLGEADDKSMMHGLGTDEATSFAILDRALEAGVNFWDTADVYGNDGLSERLLGRWFEQRGLRDQVVLATKFRFRMSPGPLGTGASRRRVVRACEDSLRRLKTDRIDLYQVHMQDLATPEEETLRALDDLVRAGKVLYTGASNYAAYRLVDAMWLSRTQNLEGYVALQMQYNLVTRALEREHVPACERFGIGIIPWSPLAGGFLSGKYKKDARPPAGSRLEKWQSRLKGFDNDRSWGVLAAVEACAAALEASPTQVSLAWLLGKRAVTSVIFGARTLEQLEDNLRAAALKLPAEWVARLDEVSALELGYPYDFIAHIQGRW